MQKIIFIILCLLNTTTGFNIQAQTVNGIMLDGRQDNNIYTAVPFLLITPNPRSGAMGNAGVAVDGDANSTVMNTAALAFFDEKEYGFSISHSPWMKRLVSDMSLSYITGYYRIDARNTISASLRYFSIGNINFTDDNFRDLGTYSPNELAFDIGYSRSLGPDFALGGNLRYINSNLLGGAGVTRNQTGAGHAVSADVSGLYKAGIYVFNTESSLNIGLSLSNIGTKMAYSNSGKSFFLPGNLKIGTAMKIGNGENKITIAFDVNKFLVPTQPIYDLEGNIIKGSNPDRSVPAGIFGSFADAPGGFSEEVKEIGVSTGFEFNFRDKFFLRGGYNYQNPRKGNLSYLTTGLGIKFDYLSLDFSYLASPLPSNPIGNTLRFGLSATFGPSKRNL